MLSNHKDYNELNKTFNEKCLFLAEQVKQIDLNAPGSILRNQYADGLSVLLRNLVVDRGKKQVSLVSQLKLNDKLIFRAKLTGLSGPNNLVSESKLVNYNLSNDQLMYITDNKTDNSNYIKFDVWLNEIVIDNKDKEDNLVTRRDVILVIADKEAAHTDSDYETVYYKICIQKKMNFKINLNGKFYTPENNLYKESLVTIAKEFLEAVEIYNINREAKLLIKKTNHVYLMMINQLHHKGFGYRFNLWLPGDVGQGAAIFNRIHFASIDYKCEYYLGTKMLCEYSNKGSIKKYSLLDFQQLTVQVFTLFIKDKNIFIAWYSKDEKFLLMSGSQVGKMTKIDKEHLFENNVAVFLKTDLIFKSKKDLGYSLGIDIP